MFLNVKIFESIFLENYMFSLIIFNGDHKVHYHKSNSVKKTGNLNFKMQGLFTSHNYVRIKKDNKLGKMTTN